MEARAYLFSKNVKPPSPNWIESGGPAEKSIAVVAWVSGQVTLARDP
jgi:hypothetical protein